LKYCPEFPERFGCIQDVRAFGHRFFTWYNDDHRHSGIALMTRSKFTTGRPRKSRHFVLRFYPPPLKATLYVLRAEYPNLCTAGGCMDQ